MHPHRGAETRGDRLPGDESDAFIEREVAPVGYDRYMRVTRPYGASRGVVDESAPDPAAHHVRLDEEVAELAAAVGGVAHDHESDDHSMLVDRDARPPRSDRVGGDAEDLGMGLELGAVLRPHERGSPVQIAQEVAFRDVGPADLGDRDHARMVARRR
jgi:hypothetical protein